jgi:AraC-like DNA-binding protein
MPTTPSADGVAPAVPDSALPFSTADWPEQQRRARANAFCASLFRQDIEPMPGRPFLVRGTVRRLPGLGVIWATAAGLVSRRRAEHVGGDDVMIEINLDGERSFRQGGRVLTIRAGEALIANDAETGVMTVAGPSRCISLRIPAQALGPDTRIRTRIARVVTLDNDVLRLLRPCLRVLRDPEIARSPELLRLAVNQVYDLAAVLIGAAREAADIAAGRGLRAARLAAIKQDIVRNLGRTDVSVGALATRHRVTPRTIQALFESEGTTLTGFVLQQRLARAHGLLCDPLRMAEKIAGIALDAGFGDLSYFNQAFRRRYGAAPTDVRAQAQLQACGAA